MTEARRRAAVLVDARQYEHARPELARAMAEDPDDGAAFLVPAILEQRVGNHEASLAALDRAAALGVAPAAYLATRMNTLYHARRFPEAVACAEELLRHDPQHLQAHILLAQILGGEGRADYARARAHAEHAVSLAPESDHAHYALGQVLASASGRWGARAALPRLQHAVRLGSSAQLALLAVLMLAVPLPSGGQVPPLVLVGLVVRVGAVLVTRSRTARYRRERRQERAQLWRTPVRDRARGA